MLLPSGYGLLIQYLSFESESLVIRVVHAQVF